MVGAPAGDVAATVRAELARARMEKRSLLVYVGATWCAPCQTFHRLVEEGRLDARLPGLRLVEFDSDRDGSALRAAGYTARRIPLFARPGADGRAIAGRWFEGGQSLDTAAAVDEVVSRLTALLQPTSVSAAPPAVDAAPAKARAEPPGTEAPLPRDRVRLAPAASPQVDRAQRAADLSTRRTGGAWRVAESLIQPEGVVINRSRPGTASPIVPCAKKRG
ncbi:MAG: thioredoxin family protein [Myxococcales bacterium]|nr:thioredoxin family protein [Myxococcales bacterium]